MLIYSRLFKKKKKRKNKKIDQKMDHGRGSDQKKNDMTTKKRENKEFPKWTKFNAPWTDNLGLKISTSPPAPSNDLINLRTAIAKPELCGGVSFLVSSSFSSSFLVSVSSFLDPSSFFELSADVAGSGFFVSLAGAAIACAAAAAPGEREREKGRRERERERERERGSGKVCV